MLDFPTPPNPPVVRPRVHAGPVATYRSLRTAVTQAFDSQDVPKGRWARTHGLTPTSISRALDPARGDNSYLRAVARAVGYEVHPGMHQHYRRLGEVDTPEVDLQHDDGLDPESRAERDHVRWEREDHDASHCDDEQVELTADELELEALARLDVVTERHEDEQDRVWKAVEEILTPWERGECPYPDEEAA